MILSGRDIKWYIESGKLSIFPMSENQFRENGVDLILSSKGLNLFSDSKTETLPHGISCLLCTQETLGMPDDLMGFVELRSTWARRGLILPPTIIDAGFIGEITLEVFNGGKDIPIPVGQRFAHIVFAKLTNPTIPYNGKYQLQKGPTKAIMDKE